MAAAAHTALHRHFLQGPPAPHGNQIAAYPTGPHPEHAAWQPFSEEDTALATATWKRGKVTGPDGIAHEALTAMMGDDRWRQRLQYLNDFLYRGTLPPQVAAGITVLLPKTLGPPLEWGDTRPITLSSPC